MQLPSSVSLTHPVPDYPVLEIRHAKAQARVALHGAHLMEWQPAGHEPVLYLSPQAVLQEGKAIRGGVPVCWPWFGPHESNPELPMHGFVRTRFWEIAEASEDADGVRLIFTLSSDESTLKLWPHEFYLIVEMHIGSDLSLALTMKNTGDTACKITGALHTYLSVNDITQVTVAGLDGTEYFDRLDGQEHHQSGDIAIDREVDREYLNSSPVEVRDASTGRTLTVTPDGSQCAVVWNPWIKKAMSLADVPDEDYKRFLCVETANAWKDVIVLAPEDSHRLATVIRCSQGDR